jgi:hypothetical protein
MVELLEVRYEIGEAYETEWVAERAQPVIDLGKVLLLDLLVSIQYRIMRTTSHLK